MDMAKTGRRWIGFAALALLAVLFAPVPHATAQQALVIAAQRTPEGVDPDVLKPGNQEIVVQVYEGLTRYARRRDADGNEQLDSSRVEGHFAESWDVSEDGRTIRLRLRQGVRSFFGNELTAEDVVWTHQKSMHQRRTGFFIATLSNIQTVEATGRYEVTYRLGGPSAIFFTNLTHYTQTAIDSTEAKRHATPADPFATEWLDRNTAGFGAYHMQSVTPNEQAIFVANPNYFRGKPFFERIIYRAVPSAASRALLIRSGQAQWVENLTIVQVDELRRDPRLRVVQTMHRATAALNMNPRYKPFDDVRVRRAFLHAMDRTAINSAVFMGRGHIASTPVLPIIDGAAEDLYPYAFDPARARALLAEAGYPDGVDVELFYADIVGWEEPMAIQAANMYRQSNIRVTPRRITPSEMRSRGAVTRRDMPFFTSEDGPIVLDIVYAMFIFARTDAVVNRAAHSNPRIDALIDQARQTLDRDARLALMRDAQRIWLEDAPWAITVYRPLFEVMPANITGYVYHPDEHERWFDLRRR
jgi:peptide/nickel transport system substrate-binding protein